MSDKTQAKPLSDAEFIKSIVTNVGDYYEDDANKFLGEALDRLEAANARIAYDQKRIEEINDRNHRLKAKNDELIEWQKKMRGFLILNKEHDGRCRGCDEMRAELLK